MCAELLAVFMGPFVQAIAFLIIAAGVNAATITAAELPKPQPPRIVLSIDTSASMVPHFARTLCMVEDLVMSLPLGSGLSLIRFDQEAVEFARTTFLTGTQRETILQRLRSQEAKGKWTDFERAVEEIRRSADALGDPLLIVVVTDAVSDPPLGVEFADVARTLGEAFSQRELVKVVLLLPNRMPVPRHDSLRGQWPEIEVLSLDETSAKQILGHMPVPLPSLDAIKEGRGNTPWAAAVAVCVIAGVCSLAVIGIRDVRRVRGMRRTGQAKAEKLPPPDLVARYRGAWFNLGPVDGCREVHLGADSGCDVQIFPAEQGNCVLILRRRKGRFFLRNRTCWPVQVNAAKIEPRREARIKLPARVEFFGGRITLLPVPRKNKQEIVSADSQNTEQEVMKK